MPCLGECSDLSILSFSKSFVRGTHPHLLNLPGNYYWDFYKTVELGLTQKHKVIFFRKLGIRKMEVSLVMSNKKTPDLPVTKIIFIANIYIHYCRVLQLIVSVLDAIYRSFPGFKVMSNWSAYEIYTKVDLFDMEINIFWKKRNAEWFIVSSLGEL